MRQGSRETRNVSAWCSSRRPGVPLVEGESGEIGGGEDCGVVDEDVELAEGGDGGVDGLTDGRFGADVARNGCGAQAKGGDLAGCLIGFSERGAVSDGYVCAGAGESER